MVAALGVLGACGDDDNDAASGAQEDHEIRIRLLAFTPATVRVEAGATVSWIQADAGTHTVTSGTVEDGAVAVTEKPDGRFDSGELQAGKRFTFTFAEPGTYPYFCTLHPATMRGEVDVG